MTKKLHQLARHIALALMTALAFAPAQARTVADFFAQEPGEVFSLLSASTRLDMVDYYHSGQKVEAENKFGGTSRIDTITDVYMRIRTSKAKTIELRMMPQRKDTIIAVVETVMLPTPDSHITFYNSHWYRLREIKPMKEVPTTADFFLPTVDKNTRREMLAQLPFDIIEMHFEGDNYGRLTAKHRLKEFLGKEEWEKWRPLLRPELNYTVDGMKIKPLKP